MSDDNPPLVPRRRAPPPPVPGTNDVRVTAAAGSNKSPTNSDMTKSANTNPARQISKFLGMQLIELVRVGTQAPHSSCVEVATLFLGMLRDELSNVEVSRALREVEEQIKRSDSPNQVWCPEDIFGLIGRSDDAMRLRKIIDDLSKRCRSDRQHRSTYFDDHADLPSNLTDLHTVCANADPRIVQYSMAANDYSALQTLLTLFCFDTREEVRSRLVDTLLCVVRTDRKAASILLESSLTFELARQFIELAFQDTLSGSTQLVTKLARMLTAVFATGEHPPVALSDVLNLQFVTNCLRTLETVSVNADANAVKGDEHGLSEVLFELLVSFNLHFTDADSNVLLAAMRCAAADTRSFTEKLLEHFNSLYDPLDHYRPASTFRPFGESGNTATCKTFPNAVAKTLADCFEDAACAELFYLNDAKALVDILLRFVVDLNAGDSRRSDVLRLTLLVVRSAAFNEHRHRCAELREAVANVAEENADVAMAFVDAESTTADGRRDRAQRDHLVAHRIIGEIDRLGTSL